MCLQWARRGKDRNMLEPFAIAPQSGKSGGDGGGHTWPVERFFQSGQDG